jgi:hypothetical protein
MNFVVEGRGLTEISLEIRHSFVLQYKKQTGKKRKKKRIMRAMVKTRREGHVDGMADQLKLLYIIYPF